jgi:excisionase family DNA binding protein
MDLRTAADRLGVHYQTAYRWLRQGTLRAVKTGSSYQVTEDELERVRALRSAPSPPPRKAQVRDWEVQVARFHRLLVAGDELGARQAVDRLRQGGVEPLSLCEDLVAPALRRLGDDWEAGLVSVAEEHRASAICERLVARIAVHPRGRPRGVCVVATPVGEEHSLPAAMAAVVLRADRWQVHHLGTRVPIKDAVHLVRDVAAHLVVLSLVNPEAEPEGDHMAELLVQETDARVLVGRPRRSLRGLVETARS